MNTTSANGSQLPGALGGAVALALAATTVAAPINYGDFSDVPPGSVMYIDVTETANSPGDSEPLYGPPTLAGNEFTFDPTPALRGSIRGAAGADLTDGQLNFGAMGANAAITQMILGAAGDYTLSDSGPAASAGFQVAITRISVLAIDGVPVSSPLVLPGSSVSGAFDSSGGAASNVPWSGTLTVDVNAALSTAGVPFQFGATKLDVQINNVLSASADAGGIAEIGMSSFVFDAVTVPVPEPTSGTALVLATLGIIGRSSPTDKHRSVLQRDVAQSNQHRV